MATHMDRMKAWIETYATDVKVLQQLVDFAGAPVESRTLAAAALGYMVSRMDLVPDWEESAGIVDDAMVLRVAAALASDRGLGEPPADLLREVARLANDADAVIDYLGGPLYARFKHYVDGLVTKEVRGRTPRAVVEDAKARRTLWTEIDDELRRLPPAPMSDPDAVARTVKNYIAQKLA